MKKSEGQGGCFPRRSKAKVDESLPDLQNSLYHTKAKFNNDNKLLLHYSCKFFCSLKLVNLPAAITLFVK